MKILNFYQSTLGKKFVVAITGFFMFTFVLGHMLGNLKTFGGVAKDGVHKLDHYAEFLRTIGQDFLGRETFLWGFRIALLIAVVLHIYTVVELRKINKKARPDSYKVQKTLSANIASKTMFFGGLTICTFIIFHVLHLTFGFFHDSFVHGRVYANVHSAFQSPIILAIYLITMCFLGLHLYHGLWSMFQTLGLDGKESNLYIRIFAKIFSVVVALGFVVVPLAIFLNLLPLPVAGSIIH